MDRSTMDRTRGVKKLQPTECSGLYGRDVGRSTGCAPRLTTPTIPFLYRDPARRRRWTGLAFSPTSQERWIQELLSRNEYLVTENRILKRQLKGRLLLSDAERATLGEIGHRLGRKALADVANAAKPNTILGWYPRRDYECCSC